MPARAPRPHPHLGPGPPAADPAPVRDPPQPPPAAPLPELRRAAETATRTGRSRAIPRTKTHSRRLPDQRIPPGRMTRRDCNFNGVTPEMEETPVTDVTPSQGQEPAELSAADEQVLRELAERARAGGLQMTGEGGLLGKLTKMVVEGALQGEMDDHLGYARHDPAGRNGSNSRNGHRAKTVITEAGPVEITVPRDRDSSFEPKIVAKRQRRLTGVDDMVISLSAKGLTHGEISAHLAEVYGAEVSKQTIPTITDRVMEGLAEWQSRPLDSAL